VTLSLFLEDSKTEPFTNGTLYLRIFIRVCVDPFSLTLVYPAVFSKFIW
jgi:hypothetical protein